MSCKAKCLKIGLLALVGVLVLSGGVMWLWNWLMPALFSGVHAISYLQSLGLLVLSKILFGGLCGRGGGHGRKYREHLEQMTPEEREKLHAGLSRFCCKRSS
jgi:hypothetical protein